MSWLFTFSFTIIFFMTSAVHAEEALSFSEYVAKTKRAKDPFSLLDSKIEQNFGDDLPIYSSKIGANTSSNPCGNSYVYSFGDGPFLQLMKQTSGATGQLFCFEKVSGMKEPYTAKYCETVNACATSILGDLGLGLGAGTFIQKVLAEDYIQSELSDHINEMEALENIAKYMKQKFPNSVTSSCPSKFSDSFKDSVCSVRINNIFKTNQKNCLFMTNHCYSEPKKGLIGFREYSEKNNGTFVNTFNMYFSQRTDDYVKKVTSSDEEAITKLLSTLTSEESEAVKEEKFYKMLLDHDMQNQYDPILTFYPAAEFDSRKNIAKKRFSKFISDAFKNKSSIDDLSKSFESIRIKLGNSLLEDNCESTPSYESLCINSENILAGNKGNKVRTDITQALNRRNLELDHKDDTRLKVIANLFTKKENDGLIGMSNNEMSMMLLENARCGSFNFQYAGINNKSIIEQLSKENPYIASFIATDNKELARELRIKEELLDNKNKLLLARARKQEYQEELENPEKRYWINSFREKKQAVAKEETISAQRNKEHQEETSIVPSKKIAIQGEKKEELPDRNLNGKSRGYQQDLSRWPGNQSSAITSPTIPNTTTSADLQRLASNASNKEEAKAEAINTDTLKSDSKKLHTKNNDELKNNKNTSSGEKKPEEFTSSLNQLHDLKNELSRLKESLAQNENANLSSQKNSKNSDELAKARIVSDKTKTKAEDSEHYSASAVSKGDSAAIAQAPSNQTSTQSPSSVSSASRSNSSSEKDKGFNASVTRMDSGRVTGTSAAKSNESNAIVLNTQENTAEQNENVITDTILSNNGKSFDVMMDGVPVRIIPLIEKGKLVYEKGKPKYQIFVRDEKDKKVSKTVADLKMNQEREIKQAAERAQYLKLKEISGKALQVK